MRFLFQSLRADHVGDGRGVIHLLADAIPGLVAYVDRDRRVRLANARHKEWLGIDPSDALGRRPIEVWGSALAAGIEPLLEKALVGSAVRSEIDVSLGHRLSRVRLDVMPDVGEARTVLGAFVLAIDVTEEHRSREALRIAHEKAVQADEAKSRFLAAASHDLRQPIHALVLSASALSRRVGDGEARSLVDGMRETLDSLTRMFNALMDLSKIDSGLVAAEIGEVPLGAMLRRLEVELGPQAALQDLRLRVAGTDLVVAADAVLLENILRNLISNALKFTRAGGILVGARRRGGHVRLEVHDTGVGIDPARIGQIFREYERSRTQADGPNPGLGLGLSIVRRLARLMGSEVHVRSTPGRGSVFWLELPLISGSRPTGVVTINESAAPSLAGVNVLLVDDDEQIRRAMAVEIADCGGQAIAAATVGEALSALQAQPRPDVLVLDYQLGTGQSAFDLIDAAVSTEPCPPIVVVTGSSDAHELRRIESRGLRYLVKPVPTDVLRREIARALSEGQHVPRARQPALGS